MPDEDSAEDDGEQNPLEDVEAFEEALREEMDRETLAAGIDGEEHYVGRIYRAETFAPIDTLAHEDGTKEVAEGEVGRKDDPNWVDQGHYKCYDCKMVIDSKVIAFLHASDRAPEFVEHLPPAIRADVSGVRDLTEFAPESA